MAAPPANAHLSKKEEEEENLRSEDADAVEVREFIGSRGVGIAGGARLAGDAGLKDCEGWEIGGAQEVVADAVDALPSDGDASGVVGGGGREHGQDGGGVGGVQSSDPVLINVEGRAIEVGVVYRAVSG